MNAFRIWTFLLPLAAGFLLPAVLAWRPGPPGLRRAGTALAVLLATTVILGLAAGVAPSMLAKACCFVAAFAAFSAGLALAFPSPVAGQIASALIVTLLGGSIFYFGQAMDPSLGHEALQSRIRLALAPNPYAILAGSILGVDVFHAPGGVLYGSPLTDYHRGIYPSWSLAALAYAGLGLSLGSFGLARSRRAAVTPGSSSPPSSPPA